MTNPLTFLMTQSRSCKCAKSRFYQDVSFIFNEGLICASRRRNNSLRLVENPSRQIQSNSIAIPLNSDQTESGVITKKRLGEPDVVLSSCSSKSYKMQTPYKQNMIC